MSPPASLHYVTFPTLHDAPIAVAARLCIPAVADGKLPAVLILHGSAGPSGREGGYADVLNQAGFITLEPDQWAARGLAGGATGRPRSVAETLHDVFGAQRFLATHPRVDPARIGAMGFSFGGVATLLATARANVERFASVAPFAAYMPLYPICWIYNKVRGYELGGLVDAPIFIVTGALDQYDDDPEAVDKLVASLPANDRARISTRVMDNAHHGFDMPGAGMVVQDPSGHCGKGGDVIMRHNPDATKLSHALALEFFSSVLIHHSARNEL